MPGATLPAMAAFGHSYYSIFAVADGYLLSAGARLARAVLTVLRLDIPPARQQITRDFLLVPLGVYASLPPNHIIAPVKPQGRLRCGSDLSALST